jgi:hypothetical protein
MNLVPATVPVVLWRWASTLVSLVKSPTSLRPYAVNAVAVAAGELAVVHHNPGYLATPCAPLPALPSSTGAGAEDLEFSGHDGRKLRSRPFDHPSLGSRGQNSPDKNCGPVAQTSASIDPGAPDEGATGLQK